MRFQFNIARLMRATAFVAVAVWATVWVQQELDREYLLAVSILIPIAIGGAIGALFGKARMGMLYGIVACYVLFFVVAGLLSVMLG